MFINRTAVLVFLSALGLFFWTSQASVVTAQTCGYSMSYGETSTGFINSNLPKSFYCFYGQAGDTVRITMNATSGDLDPYLQLTSNSLLAENDDRNGESLNSFIEFTLPTTDNYMIVATRYNLEAGTTLGDFTLTLESDSPPSSTFVDPVTFVDCTVVSYNELITGSITNDRSEAYYCFDGQAGDVVTIDMTAVSGDLDPFLTVGFDTEDERASNDDIGENNIDSRIVYTLPMTRRYVITTLRYGFADGTTTGNYTLMVTVNNSGGGLTVTGTNDAPCGVGQGLGLIVNEIAFTQTISDTIVSERSGNIYCFMGNAGDIANISMQVTSGNLDSSITLFNENNDVLTRNDNNVNRPNDAYISFFLPETGVYYISPEALNGTSGTFNVQLNSGIGPNDAPCGYIEHNNMVGGSITGSQSFENYCFNGNEGDTVQITMNTYQTLDGYLRVMAYDDFERRALVETIANSDFNDTDAYVELILPQTGVYIIAAGRDVASPAGSETRGDYQLTMQVTSAQPNNHNTTTNNDSNPNTQCDNTGSLEFVTMFGSINNSNVEDVYCFAGQSGQTVMISMIAKSGDLDTYLVLAHENSGIIAENDDHDNSTNSLITVTLPEAGSYRISASRYNGQNGTTTGDYELLLTPLDDSDSKGNGTNIATSGCNSAAEDQIAEDQTISQTISNETPEWTYCFTYQGSVGIVVAEFSMVATSGDLDTYLILTDSNGNIVATNDDNPNDGTLNSLIEFTIQEEGTYFITATRFNEAQGTTTGNFDLYFELQRG